MARHAVVSSEFLAQLRKAPEELRWRGLLGFAALAVREILSPLLYWHVLHVFEKRVEPPPRAWTSGFDVKFYSGASHLERLSREIPSLGEISAAVVASRLAGGDAVAVAYASGDPVGYSWMTFETGLEIAFDTAWALGPGEAIFHGSFTHPAWRGRGVQIQLDAALMRLAYELGVSNVFTTISAFNTPSLRAFEKTSQRKRMTLIVAHVRGVNWVYRKTLGAPFESRFMICKNSPRPAAPKNGKRMPAFPNLASASTGNLCERPDDRRLAFPIQRRIDRSCASATTVPHAGRPREGSRALANPRLQA